MTDGASQDDIDALLAELGGKPAGTGKQTAPADQAAPARQADPNAETMADPKAGNPDDIDALLNQIAGKAEVAATRETQPAGSAPASAASDGVDQDDIDALLSEIATVAEGGDAKLDLHQTKRIDAVLEQMQAPTDKGGPTLGLSTEDLEDLVAKHTPGPDQPVSNETMISQTDIDDLVAQLTAVVGGTGPIARSEQGSSAARAAATVKQPALPGALTASRPAAATTAPRPANTGRPAPAAAARTAPTTAAAPMVAMDAMPTFVGGGAAAIGVLAPVEVRGARWLLIAAVLLLAICATGMGLMVRTLSGLSALLTIHETEELQDADRFALALTAARNQLGSADPIESAIGVEALRKLRNDHPSRHDDLTLELARHWRSNGAPLKAAAEYALVSDRAARGGDPRIVLEYAETLIATGAREDAARQLYALLAREQGWLSREDSLGHPKSAEDHARDREAVQRAHLLLGSLLGQAAEARP